jgi:hypothetical protein
VGPGGLHEHPAPLTGCDPVFARWAADSLIWLPERGMGFLSVTEAPYDADYFAKYEGYAATEQGRAITAARVDLVERHVGVGGGKGAVVDVGIGCGDFVAARASHYGYDINPAGVAWLTERRRLWNPWEVPAEVLTFWDCLEHIANPAPLLANAREWVFVSLPIVPGDGPPREDWRHFRRDEHTLYWTARGFVVWMREHGFECREHNQMETALGRQDIHSFAFRRVA